jgi:hypothetical protein
MIVAVCGAGYVNRAACATEAVSQRPTIAGFVIVGVLYPFDGVARANGERFFCRNGSSHLLLRIFGFTGAGGECMV